jgi:hypothetical protein
LPGAPGWYLRRTDTFGDRSTWVQEICDLALCQSQFVAGLAIERQQQFSAELLFYRMVSITHRRLADLREQRLNVSKYQPAQLTVAIELILQHAGRHAVSCSGTLDHRLATGSSTASKCVDADDTFVADNCDFSGLAILNHGQQRNYSVIRKPGVTLSIARLVDHRAPRKGHQGQIASNSTTYFRQQNREQLVLRQAGRLFYRGHGFPVCCSFRACLVSMQRAGQRRRLARTGQKPVLKALNKDRLQPSV